MSATKRVAPARCFRCRLNLGRERFTVRFPTDNDREGEADLCGRCVDNLKTFLNGATLNERAS